jgi:hypothetical protein
MRGQIRDENPEYQNCISVSSQQRNWCGRPEAGNTSGAPKNLRHACWRQICEII